MRTRVIVALPALVILALPSLSVAQPTLKVPSHYPTIGAAIGAARKGDTVLVAPGIYTEAIDFAGKAIHVRSEQGWAVTTIRAGQSNSAVVTFQNGEQRDSILEGFTITQGNDGGIRCITASPTIDSCVIALNQARPVVSWYRIDARGGGVFCYRSSARLVGCRIEQNQADARELHSGFPTRGCGGGVFARDSALEIRRCFIAYNRANADSRFQLGTALGGGLCLENDHSLITNGVIVGNWVTVARGATGGGVSLAPTIRVVNCNIGGNSVWGWPTSLGAGAVGGILVNCIIRQNTPRTAQVASATLSHCNVEGLAPSPSGIHCFDADPRFIDPFMRIGWDSPCRNRGLTTAIALPATDYEGHPRIAHGAVDVGADEFYAGLTVDPAPGPGPTLDFRVIGEPGEPAYWALAQHPLKTPLAIPGFDGMFYLNPYALVVFPLGSVPPTSFFLLRVSLPQGLPRATIPMQALVGNQFSNMAEVHLP